MENMWKDTVEIELNRDEYMLAVATGVIRAEIYDNTPRGKDEEGEKKDSLQTSVEGAIGEMIVCKFLGVNFNSSVTDIYTGDSDIVIGDIIIDVKSSVGYDEPWLIVKENLVRNGEAEYYVCVYLEEGLIPYKGTIIGWKRSDWLENNLEPTRKFKNKPLHFYNYVIDQRTQNYIYDLVKELPYSGREENIVEQNIGELLERIDLNFLGYNMRQTGVNEWR